jgi:hypothetical protein
MEGGGMRIEVGPGRGDSPAAENLIVWAWRPGGRLFELPSLTAVLDYSGPKRTPAMIQFTGRRAPDPNSLFDVYAQAIYNGEKISCRFTAEVLQQQGEVSQEELAEFCIQKKGIQNGVVHINTEDLNAYRQERAGLE